MAFVLVTAEAIVLHVRQGPPEPPPFWTPLVVAGAMVAAAVALAWRRGRDAQTEPVFRRTRITWSAIAAAAGIVVMRTAMDPKGLADIGLLGAGLLLISFCAISLAVIGAIDLLLDLFQPHRSVIWLVAALAIFPALIVGLLSASTWLGEGMTGARSLIFAAPLTAAVITWWSLLPVARPSVAEIFE